MDIAVDCMPYSCCVWPDQYPHVQSG
jgi:hypothetical protein